MTLLAAKPTEISEALKIETVSLGERLCMANPIYFHPLWLECTLHVMGHEGRIRRILPGAEDLLPEHV
jgi:hypothetical protein